MFELLPQTKFQWMSQPFSKILNWIELNLIEHLYVWTSLLADQMPYAGSVPMLMLHGCDSDSIDTCQDQRLCLGRSRATSSCQSIRELVALTLHLLRSSTKKSVTCCHSLCRIKFQESLWNPWLREWPSSQKKQKHERNHLGSPGHSMRSNQVFILPLRKNVCWVINENWNLM